MGKKGIKAEERKERKRGRKKERRGEEKEERKIISPIHWFIPQMTKTAESGPGS